MRLTVRRLACGAGFLALALAVGCSSRPEMAQLSGKVTFKGQPVPAGFISFTPDATAGGQGDVRVCQIRDGVYDSSREPNPGVHPGKSRVRIAGFDGKGVRFWPQGKQIFNPVEETYAVPAGGSTKDFVIPDEAGRNVKIEPTADQ